MKDSGREQSDCPVCGMGLNAHTNTVTRTAPKTGDLTCCVYCSAVLVFTPVGLSQLTGRRLERALADPNVQRALEIVRQIHAAGGPKES